VPQRYELWKFEGLPVFLSVFDIFKIGIGPSSSHTMGPMTAASRFLNEIKNGDWVAPSGSHVTSIQASLHGSLAYTGIGHATDRAVILGLAGLLPHTIDPDVMDGMVEAIKTSKVVSATRIISLIPLLTLFMTAEMLCPVMPME
jgi:L-serine dehydratase